MEHVEIGVAEIHVAFNWQYANAAAREAATGFTSDDLDKFAHQADDDSIWSLSAITPTWKYIGGGTTAGTVTALRAVVVDSNKDAGDFRNLDAVNIDAGASGTAGTVDVFPTTASKGKIAIAAADNSGDTTTTITNAAQGGARTYTIPDAGGSTNFLMGAGAQSATGNFTLSSGADLIFSGTTGQNEITVTDNLADALSIKITGGADFIVLDSTDSNEKISVGSSGQKIGFLGATPAAQASTFTQTYSTATRTHANPTASTLTMADGAGTNDNSIGAITADASVIAAFQEVVDEVNKLIADVANAKQMINSLVDDSQTFGLAG